ncbi:DUF485 domain-containing protein [Actinomadura sp. 3N508]|uniref:DUF485 domain-containing protein n=1 Tax=Actinomadura sp. 3N508 TaxID=3375153 RepID=UPI00378C6F87
MLGDSKVAGHEPDQRGEQKHRAEQDRQGRGRREAPPGQYAPIAGYEAFRLLRRRYRRVAAAVGTLFLGWYFAYVGLAAFAREFMARPVAGHLNVALLLGGLQFVSTFVLAGVYVAYARRRLDPLAGELR